MIELPNDFPHQPPQGYSYEVKDYKRNVISIWLRDHREYSYTNDDVRTIWGFYNIKKRQYIAPINAKKPGKVVDITKTRSYTSMQLNLNPLEYALYS